MWTMRLPWLLALFPIALASCASTPLQTVPPPRPSIAQCDAQALAACDPMVPDADASVAAALKADAENAGRFIACQMRHFAAVSCLRVLERDGLLTTTPAPAPAKKPGAK